MLATWVSQQFTQRLPRADTNTMPPSGSHAGMASHFRSQAEQDRWLDVLLGERRRYLTRTLVSARRAVELCPLQAQAYLHLAELSFLDRPDPQRKQR